MSQCSKVSRRRYERKRYAGLKALRLCWRCGFAAKEPATCGSLCRRHRLDATSYEIKSQQKRKGIK